jgi:hypothetical protein
MKLLFVVFTSFSTLAFAQIKPDAKLDVDKQFGLRSVTVGVEKGYTKTVSGADLNKMGESTTISTSAIFNNNMTFDWRAMTSQQNSYSGKAGSPTSYQEVGPGYRYSLGKDLPTAAVKVYLQQYEKPTKRYLGYAINPSISGNILGSDFGYSIGYKRFDSFEDSLLNTARHTQRIYTISYKIDKNHSVYVKKQDQRGYTQYDGYYAGYRYTF